MSSKLIPRSTPFYCTGPRRDFLWAWLAATLLGGLPSTTWALLTGGDPLEATRAAGAMLLPRELETPRLLLAAALGIRWSRSSGRWSSGSPYRAGTSCYGQ